MILAFYNPNGGCGKTTTAVNVATELARRERSVLLVDLEADMGTSISLGVRPGQARPSIVELLLNQRRPSDGVREVTGVPNLHLVAGSPGLAGLNGALRNGRRPERRLADCTLPLASAFDDVILDSPSNFTVVSLSVPSVAQHLIVPIRADYLALESLAHFLRWYRDWRIGRPGLAQISGILLTMVDHRREATREIIEIIRMHNRRRGFCTENPADPRAPQAPSHRVPPGIYSPSRASPAHHPMMTQV